MRPEVVFLLFAMSAGLLTIGVTPPLRGPDEPAHLWRALGLARGDLVPHTANDRGDVGLFISGSWYRQFSHFNAVRQALPSERPNYREVFRTYFDADFTPVPGEQAVFVSYEGSQIYSPAPYIAYAAAAFIADALDLGFLPALYFLRLAGLIFSIAMAAYAIAVVPRLKWAFCCIAMLPTAVFQRTVISADGAAFGSSLVVLALCLRSVYGRERSLLDAIWIGFCGLTKLPQILFAILEAIPSAKGTWMQSSRYKAMIVAPGIVLTVIWTVISMMDWGADTGASFGLSAQADTLTKMQFLLAHPMHFGLAALRTAFDSGDMWRQLIGVFGWLDVPLPAWAYVAISLLLVASFLERLDVEATTRARLLSVSLVTALAYSATVFALFYITLTPVTADRIYGVQGRYFVVVLPLLAVAVSALVNRSLGAAPRSLVTIAYSVLSICVSTYALWRFHWM